MPNINVGIKRLDFTEKRGKMAVYLTDGREVIVPVSMFKDISAMPIKEYFIGILIPNWELSPRRAAISYPCYSQYLSITLTTMLSTVSFIVPLI